MPVDRRAAYHCACDGIRKNLIDFRVEYNHSKCSYNSKMHPHLDTFLCLFYYFLGGL